MSHFIVGQLAPVYLLSHLRYTILMSNIAQIKIIDTPRHGHPLPECDQHMPQVSHSSSRMHAEIRRDVHA